MIGYTDASKTFQLAELSQTQKNLINFIMSVEVKLGNISTNE